MSNSPSEMRAAVLNGPAPISDRPLQLEDVARPTPNTGEVILKVRACGVCRTDLHITEGDLPLLHARLIPGHQIVGEVVETRCDTVSVGSRVGVSWMGGIDDTCPYCRNGKENLCDNPTYTGYSRDGGYAGFVAVRGDFTFGIPSKLDDLHAAPLLCAGIIGYRSLRRAEVRPGQRVGLFGFGASAHLALPVLRHWNCKVFVCTRGESHQALAGSLGADWVGGETTPPPEQLDSAVTFAPSGDVVLAALASLRKGGIVAVNAIHLDRIPEFNYDKFLWGERELRSVANMTRQDAHEYLKLAADINLAPTVTAFPLEKVNDALLAVKNDAIDGAAVVTI